jgi:hypothetical protein
MKRSEAKKHRRRISVKPIAFSCKKTLDLAPEEIAGKILDVTEWPNFKGFGPIPGIKVAEFEVRMQEIVGSRIRVINVDGSKHVEEIIEWQPNRLIRLHMKNFSAHSAIWRLALKKRGSLNASAVRPTSVARFSCTPNIC